ncbi:MAG: TauD/TfdA family dioxygenase [Rubrivivax sp.]|nr:TauD/TfdA family dioxygenase [Rubrivivax sp.]
MKRRDPESPHPRPGRHDGRLAGPLPGERRPPPDDGRRRTGFACPACDGDARTSFERGGLRCKANRANAAACSASVLSTLHVSDEETPLHLGTDPYDHCVAPLCWNRKMQVQSDAIVSEYTLSSASVSELQMLACEIIATLDDGERLDGKPLPQGIDCATALRKDAEAVRDLIDNEAHCALVSGHGAKTVQRFMAETWIFGNLLGTPMVQNSLNHKVIEVYDRGGKTIEEGGARYHQTKQGAYVHNDGVSDPTPIDYLVLACGQKAKFGGESILIDASAVHSALESYQGILECLMSDFWFENRCGRRLEFVFFQPV